MLAQFNNTVLSSFYLWFQNKLLGSSVKAYATNQANDYTYTNKVDVGAGWLAYQGRYRGLVPDDGVDVPNSGIFVDGGFVSGDNSDIFINYEDGRVIVPASSGTALNITSNATVSEVNVYLTNDSPEQILLHSDFKTEDGGDNPYLYGKEELRDKRVYMVPACFISVLHNKSEPFSFGGEESTNIRMQVFVVAPDSFTLDAIFSAFGDTVRSTIVHIPDDEFPFGQFFSIKNFPYNYDALVAAQTPTSSTVSFLDKVVCSKVDRSRIADTLDKSYMLGFLDFDLVTNRFPRS